MKKGNYLNTILRSKKTVFTFKDIIMLWEESNTNAAKVRLNYYVKNGDLLRLRRGVYVKDKKYNKLELATRIFTPSYISFETVLAREGVIFQYQTNINVASYLTRKITVDNENYIYKKMKDTTLLNTAGIEQGSRLTIASKERAFLDTLYSNVDYYFDNLKSIDWGMVFSLLAMYENKRMAKIVNQLYKKASTP
ncbi:MAG: hypothetical protein COU65_03810 [Candidatus Pacebacteria bacterium CG10_big_fil_rev_8_21_14_0_10_42_12]|nr:MAG: hypothetical protein COU65_03810 [Candidatus Pacebacteria bacterium CG10_big_fil_rev_8_21_14_0_10_42_12]